MGKRIKRKIQIHFVRQVVRGVACPAMLTKQWPFHVIQYVSCYVMLYNIKYVITCVMLCYITKYVMLYNKCYVMLYNMCHVMFL